MRGFGGRNKYGAARTKCPLDHPHPSKLEASVCAILQARVRTGEISDLKWQASVALPMGIRWKVDWSFMRDGVKVYAEAKGFETRDYKLKLKIWREAGPAPLEIWKGTPQRAVLTETVIPKLGGVNERDQSKEL